MLSYWIFNSGPSQTSFLNESNFLLEKPSSELASICVQRSQTNEVVPMPFFIRK